MRVLYVTSNSYLRSTTSSLNAIIRQLIPRGLEPIMLFRDRGPWQEELSQNGIRCYFRSLRAPDKRAPIRALCDFLWLSYLVRKEHIELIHCNEHEHFPFVRQVSYRLGIPTVVTLHWILEHSFGHWAFAPPYQPAALQFLSHGQLQLSEEGIPAEFPPERIKLLMSGLAIDEFLSKGDNGVVLRRAWGADESTVVLGTASAIKPRKRLEDFIRLIAALRKDGAKVIGVIAGGGIFADQVYQDYLHGLIRECNLDRYCFFVGNLDPVTPFFRAIDININTSEMEILSMSICEAMACGTPTFAYDVGGNAEAVHDRTFIVPFGDLDTLIKRVSMLVHSKDARVKAGRAAERHVRENFDAPILAQRQGRFYEEILGKSIFS